MLSRITSSSIKSLGRRSLSISVPLVPDTEETIEDSPETKKQYLNLARHPRFSRNNVYLRDLFTCQYCGCEYNDSNWKDLTLDHVIPRSAGGHAHWENIVTSCTTCNVEKGSRDIRPKQMPYKPDYWELASKKISNL